MPAITREVIGCNLSDTMLAVRRRFEFERDAFAFPNELVWEYHFDEVTGGFGGLMVTTVEWTSREKVWKSYELIADYVMPQFQGSLVGLEGSNRRSRAVSSELGAAREASLEKAYRSHEEARSH